MEVEYLVEVQHLVSGNVYIEALFGRRAMSSKRVLTGIETLCGT